MKEAVQYIIPYIKKYRYRFIIGFFVTLLETMMVALPTYFIGLLVDQLISGTLTMQRVWLYLLIVTISVILSYFAAYTWTMMIFTNWEIGQKFYQDRFMRSLVFKRQAFFERFTSGDLMSRATMDVESLSELLGWGASLLFSTGTRVALYFFLLVEQGNLRLTLLCLSPYVVMVIFSYLRTKEVERRWTKRQESFAKMNDAVLEGVEGVQTVRAFAQEEHFRDRFLEKTKEQAVLSTRVSIIGRLYFLLTQTIGAVVFVLTLLLGLFVVKRGGMTLGQLITFQLYITSLSYPINDLAQNINVIQTANTSAKRLREAEAFSDGMEEGTERAEKIESVILDHYSFTYPHEEGPTLREVSLEIQRGQTIGLVGKTGCGKTTLLRQFLRQYPVGEGSFEVNKKPLSCYHVDGLTKPLGYVSQDHFFFSGTIRENVAFSVPNATDAKVQQALEWAQFTLDNEMMRDGIGTVIGENGITLSGGQRQRLSIARALLKDPDFLILDDSLSAVDAVTETKILRTLQKQRRGKTTLISSHRLSAVRDADQIYVFDQGRIIQRGTHQELMEQGGWYREQYDHQSGQEDREAKEEERAAKGETA